MLPAQEIYRDDAPRMSICRSCAHQKLQRYRMGRMDGTNVFDSITSYLCGNGISTYGKLDTCIYYSRVPGSDDE